MSLSISPLFSSSSGNCTYVGTERTGLIVDAGLAGNKVEGALQNIGKRRASFPAFSSPMSIPTISAAWAC